jgi:hypothetical protein
MADIVILAGDFLMPHAHQLIDHFKSRCVVERDWRPSAILAHNPELVITFDEHHAELGLCVAEMVRRNVATLQIMDGILEWRRTWAYPTSQAKRPLNQPVLSHKVACLGKSDARIMESWGNVGKCEVVGVMRFDQLVKNRRPIRTSSIEGRQLRLLVMTAQSPGFTPEQVEITYKSLEELKYFLANKSDIDVIWRVTQNLHRRLGVENTARNLRGTELHEILPQVDAVITTPSTTILESMLFGHPVAVLDFHNTPQFVPAAWHITCPQQFAPVLEDLQNPPLERMLYQQFCLEDCLSCHSPALPRMIYLIEEMLRIRREHLVSRGGELVFPFRILNQPGEYVSLPSESFDLEKLYPGHPVFGERRLTFLQAELEAALGTIEYLGGRFDNPARLYRLPGFLWVKKFMYWLRSRL